jgi:pilus assembly protein CpaE
MPELSVAVFTTDEDQKALYQVLVDGTAIARMSHSFAAFPQSESDPLVRRLQELKPEIMLVDLVPKEASAALRAIEVLRAGCPRSAVFAAGEMMQPQLIVSAMRAGAQEFLPRPATTAQLLDAFNRFVSAQRKVRATGRRGQIVAVLNAKGGSGATTVAVNTAMALLGAHGSTTLVDMAPLGTAALHLNLKTGFSIMDALNNLHRLDATLLDGFMARHESGLHVLAGHPGTNTLETAPADLARLFDLAVNQYRFVVVDLSTRLDRTAISICDLADTVLMVLNPDLSSIWSAARLREFLAGSPAQQKLQLVLNRYRKMSGFPDSEIENAIQSKVLWKIPNQYNATNNAIERGIPVMQNNHSDIAHSFAEMIKLLVPGEEAGGSRRLLFRSA